jgi:micrococcal nuclease
MRVFPVLVCFLILVPAMPAAGTAQAIPGLFARDVTPAGILVLDGGQPVRLDGLAMPFDETENLRSEADKALRELIMHRKLKIEGAATDRYGRTVGQVYALDDTANKIWVEGELLRRGLAFVYPPTGHEARLAEMRALEAAARNAKTGIWNDRAYNDRPAGRSTGAYGHFGFVSGKALDTKRVKGRVYVHFGENWRASFTLAIAAHDLRAFREAGIDPLAFAGKTIRFRGWIKRDIGPMIVVTDPAQIEILAAS